MGLALRLARIHGETTVVTYDMLRYAPLIFAELFPGSLLGHISIVEGETKVKDYVALVEIRTYLV